ncbi:MAG: hypothetical protein ACI4F9_07200 [Lachnospiraceae bacterium]
MMLLFSLYGCGKDDVATENGEEIEEINEEDEEIEEENEMVSGNYIPESNKFELQLPKGDWIIEREEEGMVSLQSEDGQSYFEIAYLSEEEAKGALGETPTSKEELEEQISYGESSPTVISFDKKTGDGVEQTVYTLKYADGDYPYMIQGNYVKNGEFFTVIAMTKLGDESFIGKLQESLNQFKIQE